MNWNEFLTDLSNFGWSGFLCVLIPTAIFGGILAILIYKMGKMPAVNFELWRELVNLRISIRTIYRCWRKPLSVDDLIIQIEDTETECKKRWEEFEARGVKYGAKAPYIDNRGFLFCPQSWSQSCSKLNDLYVQLNLAELQGENNFDEHCLMLMQELRAQYERLKAQAKAENMGRREITDNLKWVLLEIDTYTEEIRSTIKKKNKALAKQAKKASK